MLALAIVACLASDPNHCRDFEIAMADATKMQCMYASQIVMAQWAADHPHYRIVRHACVPKTGKV